MNQTAYLYCVENKNLSEVSEILRISKSTVSRLLKRAFETKVVEYKIAPDFERCIELERKLKEICGFETVLVAPVEGETDALEIKKKVALEGARYVQRAISDGDVIGLSWGGTMYHLIQYLNPCQKAEAKIITMHGDIAACDKKLSAESLVKRAAMAFGGKHVTINNRGLFKTRAEIEKLKRSSNYLYIQDLFKRINISVSGVGVLYPHSTTPLYCTSYINDGERAELQKAYCDIMLRFIGEDGAEYDTSMKERTLSIDLATYIKIPHKIVVASGADKAHALKALKNGSLLDVLIVDQDLARAFLNLII
jgi:deoxyribonucleoside regulator